jgi:hypothetical protein
MDKGYVVGEVGGASQRAPTVSPPPIFFGPSMFHVSFFVVRCTSRSRRWLYIYRDFKGQDEYRGTNINGIGATRANVGPMAHGLPPRAVVLLSALWLAHVRSKYTMSYFSKKNYRRKISYVFEFEKVSECQKYAKEDFPHTFIIQIKWIFYQNPQNHSES